MANNKLLVAVGWLLTLTGFFMIIDCMYSSGNILEGFVGLLLFCPGLYLAARVREEQADA